VRRGWAVHLGLADFIDLKKALFRSVITRLDTCGAGVVVAVWWCRCGGGVLADGV
jgi:hypothetical protein